MTAFFQTLRFRLAFLYSGLLACVLVAFAVLLYASVRMSLLRHHDQDLRRSAEEVESVLSRGADCAHLDPGQIADLDTFGRLVLVHSMDGEERTFYTSPELASLSPEVRRTMRASSPSPRFDTVGSAAGTYRIYSRPYRSRTGRPGVIHVMERLGDVEEPLEQLRTSLAIIGPGAILAVGLGGYLLARRALTPVDAVTAAAREIEATQLSRRIPEPAVHDEIGRLVDTFNQMIARLETSFDGMKRFTADASHQLRTPLTTMRGLVDVVLDRPRSGTEYVEALKSLGEEVDHLRSITEDLLMLARADSRRIEFERSPVRLDRLVSDVLRAFEAIAAPRDIRLLNECEKITVSGDERWLNQLFFNLVDNAVKFSESGDAVVVRGSLSGQRAVLSVSDSGPGIPIEDLGHIFERFYRPEVGHRKRSQGSGLGLAIAAWIAREHGGEIRAANRPEGGTLLEIWLPADSGAPAMRQRGATQPESR